MAFTLSAAAVNVAANISTTETVLVGTTGGVGLITGNVYRITIDSNLPSPQFGLNFRIGTNGTITDNLFYSANNVQSNTYLLNDLNNWANNNPGLSPTTYPGPAKAGVNTPLKCEGRFYLIVTANTGGNANVSLIAESASPDANTLIPTLGASQAGGLLYTANVGSLVQPHITVTAQAFQPNVATFVGVGQSANVTFGPTPQSNGWNLVTPKTTASNGYVTLIAIEALS